MPQNAFFPRTHDLLVSQKNNAKTLFSTLHPLSPVIFATTTVVAFVLLHNSRFNLHCYTQHEAVPTQKLAWKWCCDFPWLLAWKITKSIHSCKPASLNRPILACVLTITCVCVCICITMCGCMWMNMCVCVCVHAGTHECVFVYLCVCTTTSVYKCIFAW